MKKILYITSAVLALLAVSCAKVEVSDNGHEPGPQDVEGCYGVYFPTQEASGAHTYDPLQEPKVEITVGRKDRKGEITVPFKIISETPDVFTAGDIKFANGDSLTTVIVDFPTSELGKNYSFTIKVDDPQYVSYYGGKPTSLDFSVMRVEYKYVLNPKTNEPAWFSYTDDWYGLDHRAKIKYYEVDGVRYCESETEPYIEGGVEYPGFFSDGFEVSFEWYTKASMEDPKGNVVQPFHICYVPVAYEPSYDANVMMTDYYSYWTIVNPQAALAGKSFVDFVKGYATNYPLSYYDGNGGFYFYTHQYHLDGTNLAAGVDDYNVIMIGEGFTRTDYSVEVQSDYCEDGAVPVEFKLGADVAKVNYTVLSGELTKTQVEKAVEAIKDGTADNVCTVAAEEFEFDEEDGFNYYDATITPEGETGDYTLVAVTYDGADEAQSSSSEAFYFVAKDDDTFDVDLNIEVEDTPARYESLDCKKQNSFKVSIWGSDLVDVRFGVYSDATLKKYGEAAIIENLRTDDDSALPEEELDAANTLAGFSSIVNKLSANTGYWACAWATNGKKTSFVKAFYKTEGLPNELVGEGIYTYNGLFTGTDLVTLEHNPNDDTFVIVDPFEFGTDLVFAVDEGKNIFINHFDVNAVGAVPAGYSIWLFDGADVLNESGYKKYFGDEYSHIGENGVYYFCNTYVIVDPSGKLVSVGAAGVETFDLNVPNAVNASRTSFSFENMQKVSKENLKNINFSISEKYGSFEIESDTVRTVKFKTEAAAHGSFEKNQRKAKGKAFFASTEVKFAE